MVVRALVGDPVHDRTIFKDDLAEHAGPEEDAERAEDGGPADGRSTIRQRFG
jgi:hypothetical protein